jgi:hypothetical protein
MRSPSLATFWFILIIFGTKVWKYLILPPIYPLTPCEMKPHKAPSIRLVGSEHYLREEIQEARKAVQVLDDAVRKSSCFREISSELLEEANRALSRLEQVGRQANRDGLYVCIWGGLRWVVHTRVLFGCWMMSRRLKNIYEMMNRNLISHFWNMFTLLNNRRLSHMRPRSWSWLLVRSKWEGRHCGAVKCGVWK